MTETGRVRRDNVPASHSLKMETNVAVPMRDGTILYADISLGQNIETRYFPHVYGPIRNLTSP